MEYSLIELASRVESGMATQEERERFEAALESRGQQRVREQVRALAEDTPSLEWRSRLNERLRSLAPKPARPWFLRPTVGLAAGAALAAALFFAQPRPVPTGSGASEPSLEASLILTHRETVRTTDIAGVGLTPHDLAASHRPAPAASPYDWNELDLETL
ncbi:MAG: hypothetical protein M9921_01390 [Fimbriimonadaceae bacterium]|nr:hypothetical protein [Fimbriimonadaceae bacterium]